MCKQNFSDAGASLFSLLLIAGMVCQSVPSAMAFPAPDNENVIEESSSSVQSVITKGCVTITVVPDSGVSVYAVEDTLPKGVTPGDISESGVFDAVNNKVKWGPWFDAQERTLSYKLVVSDSLSGIIALNGFASFDGVSQLIAGERTYNIDGGNSPAQSTISEELVTIEVRPDSNVLTYAIEETLPVGMSASDISDGGVFDAVNRKIKWGPWFDAQSRTVSYTLIPYNGFIGVADLVGVVSFNGASEAIGGDRQYKVSGISTRKINGLNVTLSISPSTKASVYAVEETLPAGSTAKDISDNGVFDSVNNIIKWGPWFDTQTREITYTLVPPEGYNGVISLSGFASFDGSQTKITGDNYYIARPADNASFIYSVVEDEVVSLITVPGKNVQSYAVEENLPTGAAVSDITGGGVIDQVNKKIKWGPFMDNQTRTLTYRLTRDEDFSGVVRLVGIGSFDGADLKIAGDRECSMELPVILVDPEGYTAISGQRNVTFRVLAKGTAPLNYQWYKDGIAIPDATEMRYDVTDIDPDTVGNYSAVVSNKYGTASSKVASLDMFTYTIRGGKAVITQYYGSAESVSIPYTIEGCPVYRIEDNAFAEQTNLASVTIAATVTEIGSGAFAGCSDLKNVYFEGDDPVMGENIFTGCSSEIKMHYVPNEVSGELYRSMVWGKKLYHIIDDVIIPDGVTLTLLPGITLKFAEGKRISVSSGGTLIGKGTLAQPIVLTSIKDDTYAGDTNDDGDASWPEPGDWNSIDAESGSVVTLSYTSILYSSRSATHGAFYVNGGTVSLDGCTIAHCLYDAVGCESGVFNIKNSLIYDCLLAFRHWPREPIVNCTIYDVGRLTQGGGQHFVNCIFCRVSETWEAFGWSSTYDHCLFYNPAEFTEMQKDSVEPLGQNGNLWGDPQFYDTERQDFRILSNSPAVDAADGTQAPSKDYYGQSRRTMEGSARLGSPMANGMYPDIGFYEVTDNAESNLDLLPLSISGTINATVGEKIKLVYEVTNAGSEAISGSWRDRLFMKSDDPALGTALELDLGWIVVSANLNPGESEVYEIEMTMPPVDPGQWQYGVQVNAGRELFEGTNVGNNTIVGTNAATVEMPSYMIGDTLNALLPGGSSKIVKIIIPAGENVIIQASGSVQLQTAVGRIPTADFYNQSVSPNNIGVCTITLKGGAFDQEYYLLISNESFNPTAFELKTEIVTLSLIDVGLLSAGDSETVNIPLSGIGFEEGMSVVLRSVDSGNTIQSSAVIVRSQTSASASFDLTGQAAGQYRVVLSAKGTESVGEEIFHIVHNAQGKFEMNWIIPENVRKNRTYNTYIEYKNSGDAPLMSPIIKYSSSIDGMILATGELGGILKPGESGRISVPLSVDDVSGSITCYARATSEEDEPMDWSIYEKEIRPQWIDDAAWSVFWNQIQSELGATSSEFVKQMSDAATWLAENGQPTSLVKDLVDFKVNQILGLNFQNLLETSLDDQVSARGLPLELNRNMYTSVSRRYRNSGFGYGWTHNYDIKLTEKDGVASIQYGDRNSTRYFINANAGSKWAMVGDLGVFPVEECYLEPYIDYRQYHVAELSRRLVREYDLDGKHYKEYDVLYQDYCEPFINFQLVCPLPEKPYDTPYELQTQEWEDFYRQQIKERYPGLQMYDEDNNPVELYRLINGDLYYYQQNYTYEAQNGDLGTLVRMNTGWLLTEKDGRKYYFDSNGDVIKITNQNGQAIDFVYENGLLKSLNHSDGQYFLFSYNGSGKIERLTDSYGKETIYSYQGEHLSRVQFYDGTSVSYEYISEPGSPRDHALCAISHSDGNHFYYDYDGYGRVICKYRDEDHKTTLQYDAGMIAMTDPLGHVSRMWLGINGEVLQSVDPLGNISKYQYDENGKLISASTPNGNVVYQSYNSLGQLETQTDALGNTTQYGYGDFGYLSYFTDARGNSVNYSYDDRGNLAKITYPDGSSEVYDRNENGDLIYAKKRSGLTQEMIYDAEGRLTQIFWSNGRSCTYTYDENGNQITASDSKSGDIYMQYDERNWLTQILYPNDLWLQFTYDASGRRIKSLDQSGFALYYEYDLQGLLVGLKDADANYYVQYEYDAEDRLIRETNGNGTSVTYSYDANGQVTRVSHFNADNEEFAFFAYTYDADGNVVSMETTEGVTTYVYDASGQLTGVNCPDGTLWKYVYDVAGNRIKTLKNGVETVNVVNELNQYTAIGADSQQYDMDGNLVEYVKDGVKTVLSYDEAGRVCKVTTGTTTVKEYEYNALGERYYSKVNGVAAVTVRDPFGINSPVAEYTAEGALTARYLQGLGLTAKLDPAGNAAYYHYDWTGNTRFITSADGEIANSYQYLPFGERTVLTESIENPFGYSGRWGCIQDSEDRVYMRCRTYNPFMGRFVQMDPIGIYGGDLNFYRYCANSPILNVDFTGTNFLSNFLRTVSQPEWVKGLRYGGLILGGVGGAILMGMAATVTAATVGEGLLVAGVCMFGASFLAEKFFPKWADKIDGWWSDDGLEKLVSNTRKNIMNAFIPTVYAEEYIPQRRPPPNNDIKLPELPDGHYTTSHGTIVESEDPNEIWGPEGYGSDGARYVSTDDPFDYKILYENKATATAAALEITINNQIPSELDLQTFVLGDVAVGQQVITGLNGKQQGTVEVPLEGTSYHVRVQVTVDLETRTVVWYMRVVDPSTRDGWPEDAIAGLLPPNNDRHDGEGYVCYSIHPNEDQDNRTEIVNKARIVFDTNNPIDTPEWLNTVCLEAPEAAADGHYDSETNSLNWTGSATSASYDLYIWQVGEERPSVPTQNVTATSYTLPGSYAEGSYHWQVVARNPNGTTEGEVWDFTVSGEIPHPADTNEDYIIDGMELIDYANRWLLGTYGIPSEHLMQGAYIWLAGGMYEYDASLAEPYCWIMKAYQ